LPDKIDPNDPDAPKNLTAAVSDTGQDILLTWEGIEGASQYNVYRSIFGEITDASALTPILENVKDTSVSDKNADTGVTYFYAITVLDAAGNENKTLVSNSPNATLILGNVGGTAKLPDGTNVTFKANGIAEDVSLSAGITINTLVDPTEPKLAGAIANSRRELIVAMQDASSIETFQEAAYLSIPYSADIKDSDKSPQIFKLGGDVWTKLETKTVDTDDNIVTAQILSPGIYRLAEVPLLLGDANEDGVVDVSDLILVGKDFGKTGIGLDGDVNGDEVVDISDLLLVGLHFGDIISKGG